MRLLALLVRREGRREGEREEGDREDRSESEGPPQFRDLLLLAAQVTDDGVDFSGGEVDASVLAHVLGDGVAKEFAVDARDALVLLLEVPLGSVDLSHGGSKKLRSKSL